MSPRRFDPDVLRREMEEQRGAFLESARIETGRLGAAQERLQAVWQSELDEDLLLELQRRAHKIAGRGGTFGFPQVSETARALEREMDRIIRASKPMGAKDVQAIGDMLERVRLAVETMS